MQDQLQLLKYLIFKITPVPDSAWNDFTSVWHPLSAKRKEIITFAGEMEKHIYFVVEGVQRVYYFDDQGREATLVFTYAPSFGGVLDAFMLQQPSKFFYETLTPSKFLRSSFYDFQSVTDQHLSLQKLMVKGLSQTISGVLERLAEIQCYSSEDKFRKLLERSPHILQLVPHKYLANYLGIDPTNFSKFINKIKI